MKLKSCAFTQAYKGGYVHQRTDGSFCAQFKDKRSDKYFTKECKTWIGAQRFITKNQQYIKREE